ncbi:MAG: hypothetical protein JY451_06680 [Erythrobacter sp.]|nr:MAG: hypothetical protein JY451_06680 [Erythrobacter sp.]
MIKRGTDRADFLRSAWALLALWAAYAAVRLAIQPWLGWYPPTADDWTRLIEVRALLDGQSWWDVTQYRIAPPDGFSMHWSRLVDLPLALAIGLLGEDWGMATVPLLWLLPALFALRSIMLRLGFSRAAYLFGLVLLPLFPLLPGTFAPFAVDHHGPQAVLGLACAALLLSDSRWGAAGAGFFAATWVVISLEGLPMVAVLAGLYGLRYLGEERRLLPWFLLSLTLCATLLSLATRPNAELLGSFCDILLPGHIAAFAVATLVAGMVPFLPYQHSVAGRLAGLGLIALASLPVALAVLGPCAANPMAALDPVLATWWHGYITEGLPFWNQPLSVAAMLIWALVPIVGGYWLAGRGGGFTDGMGVRWLLLLLYALAAWAYSLLLMREAVLAQLLAIPFAAVLLALLLPQARALTRAVPRIAATLACVVLATPMVASALTKPLDPLLPSATMARGAAAPIVEGSCDYSRLAVNDSGLEPGLVFTTMDAGPRILGLTDHSIVAASYHRNQRPMADVITGFTGSVEQAREIISSYRADYVLACLSASDFALYRTAAPDNLANVLAGGEVPVWLQPVRGYEDGALRLYRVR